METEDKSAVLRFKSQWLDFVFFGCMRVRNELWVYLRTCIRCCCYLQHWYVFVSVNSKHHVKNFEIHFKKNRLYNEHYPSILVTFLKETEHFSGKNGALRWSILAGKQKDNVQKPSWSFVRANWEIVGQFALWIRRAGIQIKKKKLNSIRTSGLITRVRQ